MKKRILPGLAFAMACVVATTAGASGGDATLTVIIRDQGSFNLMRAVVMTYRRCELAVAVDVDHLDIAAVCDAVSTTGRSLGISTSALPARWSVVVAGQGAVGDTCRLAAVGIRRRQLALTLECREWLP
ncbi:MAG: hypothetical protein HYV17_07970 [Xanthomonadales bacterium]|nr:hypothetical protein [Xanthomonadales bacterium]